MAENGRISYSVGLDNSGLRADAAESRHIIHEVGEDAVVEGQKMDDAFKKVGVAVAGAFSVAAATQFARKIIDVRSEIQSLEISFKTLLGSETKAKQLFGDIREFAVNTPMMLKDLAGGAQTLLGFGVSASEIMPIMKAIGDISMGNAQKFNSLTLSFAQASSTGKLMGQDFLQMVNAGFNPLNQMSKSTGKSVSELKDEMSKGAISAEMLKQAFMDATKEGGTYYGMLEQQSKGISGAISNLQGAFDDMYNAIGEKMQQPFVNAVEMATTLAKHYEEIAKVIAVLVAAYGTYRAALIAVAAYQKTAAIWGEVQAFIALTKSVTSAKDAMLLLNLATKASPIGLVLSALAAGATAFMLFSDSTDKATEALKKEQQEAEEFEKKVSASAGRAQAAYRGLQEEYKKCKNDHEKTEWIKNSKERFKELGMSVTDVNTAENIFMKNTQLMMEAFKKRAEAAAWQSRIEAEYAKRVERQMQLENLRAKLVAGAVVSGSSHSADSGDEYVNRAGNWVYTEQGAAKARASMDNTMKNDPILREIDQRINMYTDKVAEVSSAMSELYKKAGNAPELSAEEKKKADEAAKKAAEEQKRMANEQARRNSQIQANAEEEKKVYERAELDKRQARISLMKDGFDKEMEQNKLNYDRMMAENKKREDEMIKSLEDRMVLEWKNNNPKATEKQELDYRNSLNLTAKNLTPEQQAQIKEFASIAGNIWNEANKASLDRMLDDVITYEEKRAKIEEEYAQKRENLLYRHDENGNRTGRNEGVTDGHVAELDRQRDNAIQAVDEEYASREEAYRAWMESISTMTLLQLEQVLKQAQTELDKVKASGKGGQQLAVAQAKVAKAQKAVADAKAKDNLSPNARTLKDWKELHDVLQEGVKGFEDLGEAIGGTAGEIMKAAGQIMSGTLSMINGIKTLTENAGQGMEATATAGATAMSTVEKASVILAVISAALQVATAIAGLFNNDDKKQKEIERLQSRIDQLQWELDNADVVRLRDNTVSGLTLVKKSIEETRKELILESIAVNNVAKQFKLLFGSVSKNQELLQKSAQKIADTYANIAYTANKALGNEKYSNARKDLENIAQQQILLQEQIRNEESKKKTDKNAIKDYENKIEELGNKALELINEMVEDIIGGTSSDITSQLSDAFFEAFQNGEDYAKAWGDKVNDIVADVMKRMLVQKYLEEPLGEIFDKYKSRWFSNGQFNGLDAVINSMQSFASDLNSVGQDFAAIWENLPDSVKNVFVVTADADRQASEKGIATASQESVDELSGRATTIQGHTYSIMENTKTLVTNTNHILQGVQNIDSSTAGMNSRMERVELNVKEMKNTLNDIALKGIKLK